MGTSWYWIFSLITILQRSSGCFSVLRKPLLVCFCFVVRVGKIVSFPLVFAPIRNTRKLQFSLKASNFRRVLRLICGKGLGQRRDLSWRWFPLPQTTIPLPPGTQPIPDLQFGWILLPSTRLNLSFPRATIFQLLVRSTLSLPVKWVACKFRFADFNLFWVLILDLPSLD